MNTEELTKLLTKIALPITGKSGNDQGAPEFTDAAGDELHDPDAVAAIVAVVNAWPMLAPLAAAAEKYAEIKRRFDAEVDNQSPTWIATMSEAADAHKALGLAALAFAGRGE